METDAAADAGTAREVVEQAVSGAWQCQQCGTSDSFCHRPGPGGMGTLCNSTSAGRASGVGGGHARGQSWLTESSLTITFNRCCFCLACLLCVSGDGGVCGWRGWGGRVGDAPRLQAVVSSGGMSSRRSSGRPQFRGQRFRQRRPVPPRPSLPRRSRGAVCGAACPLRRASATDRMGRRRFATVRDCRAAGTCVGGGGRLLLLLLAVCEGALPCFSACVSLAAVLHGLPRGGALV